ncbi:hypothetical protein D3C86_1442770 [compost metagenome]
MIAFAAGDAGIEPAHSLSQRLDLANGAAGVGCAAPQVAARIGDGQGGGVGRYVAHVGQTQPFGQFAAIGQGLKEVLTGFEEDDGQVGLHARDQVQQHRRLGPEGGNGGSLAPKSGVQHRAQQVLGVGAPPLGVEAGGQSGDALGRGCMSLPPDQPVIAGCGLIGGAEDLIHAPPRRGVGAGRQFHRVKAATAQVSRLIREDPSRRDQTTAIALTAQDGGQRKAAPVTKGLEL